MSDDRPATLEDRVDAYLDGALSPEETARFEGELLRPDVAGAFAEGLALRELLRSIPPEEAPEGLTERIAAQLPAGAASQRNEVPDPSGAASARAILSALGWAVRGPLAAASAGGTGPALSGFESIRYALGPLTPAPRSSAPRTWSRRSLWKRVIGMAR